MKNGTRAKLIGRDPNSQAFRFLAKGTHAARSCRVRLAFLAALLTLSVTLAACASRSKIPHYEEAFSDLKGSSLTQVKERLGPPADQQALRYYWFLTRESRHHPGQKAILHEFIFINDKLVRIEAR